MTPCAVPNETAAKQRPVTVEEDMTELTWSTPEACEICVGMEVTSYMSAAL